MAVVTISGDLTWTNDTVNVAQGEAGEAITEKFFLYKKESDGKLYNLINTDSETAKCIGIAILGGALGDTIPYLPVGAEVKSSANDFAQSQTYVASATAGKVQLDSDLSTTNVRGDAAASIAQDKIKVLGTIQGTIA